MTVNDYHKLAMDHAEMAMIARATKDMSEAYRLFKEALALELKAIAELEKGTVIEPTYSILHRSAATLALDCNEPRQAEKLVTCALSKDPPHELQEELRDLLERINFRRHLFLRGIELDEEDEMQMSLAGNQVGLGIVHSQEFLQRVDDASKLIYRIVERKLNRPFRERGRIKGSIKDEYEIFVSVPRAASFAVTLKLGMPTSQKNLPGISGTSEIVDEFMDLMTLVNRSDHAQIEALIPDLAYRTNFVQLAKRIAPDGNDISLVGFTSVRKGHPQFVEVTKHKNDILDFAYIQKEVQPASEKVEVKGILCFADATHQKAGLIRIINKEEDQTYTVKVPEGMMNDIVKPLWDCSVVVRGKLSGQNIELEDIEEQ